jgi:hypothetical protein
MVFSTHRLGSPPPDTPKGTWFSAMHLTAFRKVLRCIQNALKPALRAAESASLTTSTIQAFEDSRLPFFQASIAHRTEVSAHRFSRPNTKEATSRDTKGAMA